MPAGPLHEVADVRLGEGELSFDTRIGDGAARVWMRVDTPGPVGAEAVLAACLLPAMRFGGALELPVALSPRLLRNQREFQALQEAWSRGWDFDGLRLHEVEVRARSGEAAAPPVDGRVAAFFSGGVDSWATVLDTPDLTDLIFVRGIDLTPAIGNMQVADEVEARLRGAAEDLELAFHVVETNLRELSDPLAPWDTYYGCALTTVALFLAPRFERVLIAGDSDFEVQVEYGANRLVDQLFSTETLEIVEAGGRHSRIARLARIADHPVVRRTLRICWQNLDGAYNCGRCRKCLLTMASLEALGALGPVETFPSELDLEAVAALEVQRPVSLCIWEDVLDAARAAGRPDLERAVEPVVASGKRTLGLPTSYRRRSRPGPPPTAESAAIASPLPAEPHAFFTDPETAATIAAAPAIAVLVGSYDGSGNYGDIAQLDATLGLLRRHDPELPVLPVLERGHLAGHRELTGAFVHAPRHVLFFGPGERHDDDLVPAPTPAPGGFAACLLYGGGYLNPSWGSRKLAMLGAAEELLSGAARGGTCRLSSGLQVDREWISGLGGGEARALRRFELLGARDSASVEALAALGADAPVLDTGDDAVGVLPELPPTPVREPGEELRVNVHIAEHEWVTGHPGGGAGYVAEILAELGRRADRPVVAQPLIAYLDRRVDERPGFERLAAECARRGVELEQGHVLRPASLAAAAPQLRRAALTVSRSYHVALTSLMLGVPAALLAENEYYRQKAAGLAAAFGLAADLTLDPGGDPRGDAAGLAAVALDDPTRAETARGLAAGAARLRERRATAEEELLARLAAARAAGEHEVANVEHRDGELSFLARVGGREQRVRMRAAQNGATSATAILPATLMPAMRFGGRLSLPVPVSPRVLRTQREFQGIQVAWSRSWEFGDPPLSEVEVVAPTAPPEPRPEAEGRVAVFFSGGVDSWSTVLDQPDLTDLIFVRGVDLMYGEHPHAELAEEVETRLREAAGGLGLGFHVVETNLRELSDPDIRWEAFFGCALDAVAHFLAPRFERVLLTGDVDHEAQAPIGASRLIDQLWSSERLEVVQAGGGRSRIERTRAIAGNPLVRRSLRVCWENRDGAYNCGRCRKCLFTMVTLEALGMRGSVETFPAELELDRLDEAEIAQHIQLVLWEDVLDLIRESERIDLAPTVARSIARGKRNLGLPLSHRGRATPGPPPLRGYAAATAAPGRR